MSNNKVIMESGIKYLFRNNLFIYFEQYNNFRIFSNDFEQINALQSN